MSNSEKLAQALAAGPVRAIGGIVYNSQMQALMNTTDLHGAIQELGRAGMSIQRTDAGGSPTWDVVENKAQKIVNQMLSE